ncbi:MAG: YceI family protein [Mucilaginibacter sp.]
MKKFLLPILLVILAITAFTRTNSTVASSAISFKIKNMGISTNGTVGGLQADVNFNPADPASGTMEASVDANSINTDNTGRDEHLKEAAYFDVAHYPKITLKSISFKRKGGNNYTGLFNLTIKDKTRQVEIPFSYSQKENTSTFKGTFKLNRLNYGVGGTSLILSDEVTVVIDAEIAK